MAQFLDIAREFHRMCQMHSRYVNDHNTYLSCGECPMLKAGKSNGRVVETARSFGSKEKCSTFILTAPKVSERVLTEWSRNNPEVNGFHL